MHRKFAKFLVVIFILALSLPTVALAEGMGTSMTTPETTPESTPVNTAPAVDVNIALTFDKAPVKTGENGFKIFKRRFF
jgi:hypothetical protein